VKVKEKIKRFLKRSNFSQEIVQIRISIPFSKATKAQFIEKQMFITLLHRKNDAL